MKHQTLTIMLAVLMSMTASVVYAEEHEYVDLGLPSGTLWATCNVGANAPEEYGDYFAWGEAKTKSTYDWGTYKYCNGTNSSITKYCTTSTYGSVDNKTQLDLQDDAAYVNWGKEWCMPSQAQWAELIFGDYTTTVWIKQNGVYGRKITSKANGYSIFLPAAGKFDGTQVYFAGSSGEYWASTILEDYPDNAYNPWFNKSIISADDGYRYLGLSIRPVRHILVGKCSMPTITYKNGKLTFASDTEGVQFVSEITDTDIKAYNEAEIDLSVTYTIRVHATHPEFYDSEEAVATLCWIEVEPKAEGIETDVKEMATVPVLIQSNNGTLRITGAEDGMPVSIYTISGQLLGTTVVRGNEATVSTNLHDGIAIVKMGNRAVKVLVK